LDELSVPGRNGEDRNLKVNIALVDKEAPTEEKNEAD